MEHDFNWYLDHPAAYEALTVEQLHILGNDGTVPYGDTAEAESNDAPVVAEIVAAPVEIEQVVLAKDGVHTIPFEEFRAAKDRAQTAEERNTELESQAAEQLTLIESLKAAKVADKDTGETVVQDEVLARFQAEYPELADVAAPWIKSLVDANKATFDAQVAALKVEFAQQLAPIQQSAHTTAIEAHLNKITGAHLDFEALMDSGKVSDWVANLPSYAKAGAEQVMAKGTAAEVVELLSAYKASAGITSAEVVSPVTVPAGLSKSDAKLAADIAIAKAKNIKPLSLTDIPTASVSDTSDEPTNIAGWSAKFAQMTPEAILKSL